MEELVFRGRSIRTVRQLVHALTNAADDLAIQRGAVFVSFQFQKVFCVVRKADQ